MPVFLQQAGDPVVDLLGASTEEGKKVQRNGGKTFPAVFRRIADKTLKEPLDATQEVAGT